MANLGASRSWFLLATLTIALSLCAPASAQASIRSKRVVVTANGQIATAVARCTHGRAVTGGFAVTPPLSEGSSFSYMKVFRSERKGKKAWKVSAQAKSDQPTRQDLRSFVICYRHAPATTVRSHSVDVPSSPTGITGSKAKCPKGRHALSGGFSFSTPNFLGQFTDSYRVGQRGWRARVDAGTAVTVKSIAYCSRTRITKVKQREYGAIGVAGLNADSGQCPRSTHLYGGGVSQPDAVSALSGSGFSRFSIYNDIGQARWSISGQHVGATRSHLIDFAYCG